ncbi:hypothetical protein BYT27DRAFT_7191277 [Phlegmacium glaucopus]|nr:hypothetical protein BYT27DRAFT_7191277 [Phlegmacium glaucopus]
MTTRRKPPTQLLATGMDSIQIPRKRDQTYFFNPLVIQVENVLFKVPSYYFENKSDKLASTSTHSNSSCECIEESSEDRPFVLDGILANEFKLFLATSFPIPGQLRPVNLTEEEWVSILKLSTLWDFSDVRQTAITKLDSSFTNWDSEMLKKILLGITYHSTQLFISGCLKLSDRPDPLTETEAMELGYDIAFRLGNLRERRLKNVPVTPEYLSQVFVKELSMMTPDLDTLIQQGLCLLDADQRPRPVRRPTAQSADEELESLLQSCGRRVAVSPASDSSESQRRVSYRVVQGGTRIRIPWLNKQT